MTKICPDCQAEVLSTSQPSRMGATAAFEWRDGAPAKPWSLEWFIAETTFGDRVCLVALPDEWTYDFKTADDTYIKADKIKRWMQFPDSEFIAPAALAATPAVGGDMRELIAAMLLARDECEYSKPIPTDLISWGSNVIGVGKDAKHSGDCTNECHTCNRCLADWTLQHADQLIAAAQPASPLRGRDDLIEKCAKIADPWPGFQLQDDSPDRDFAVVGCRTEIAASIRALKSVAPPEQPAAAPVTGRMCPDCGRAVDGPTHAAYCSPTAPYKETQADPDQTIEPAPMVDD